LFSTQNLDSVSKEVKIDMDNEKAIVYLDNCIVWEGSHSFAFNSVYPYLVFSTAKADSHEVAFEDLMIYDSDFNNEGVLTNTIKVDNTNGINGIITWTETAPAGTDVKFQTRTSSDGISGWSEWSSYYTDPSGENISSPPDKYLQYRALLSTQDKQITPRLHSVRFDFGFKNKITEHNVYNYPNPFSPLDGPTNLTFSVSRSSDVEVTILSAIGRKVWGKTLGAGKVLAGKNIVPWDGRDSSGKLVPNGVYLLVVEAEGKKVFNKIAVIR